MQAIDVERSSRVRAAMPMVGLGAVALAAGGATAAFGPLVVLPLFGAMFVVLVMARPEYGIAMFLSTFLAAYPQWMQGSGFLTVNNVLGGIFLMLLTYKVYRDQEWWFLRCPEIQIAAFMVIVFYLGDRFNGPDPRLISLLGADMAASDNLRTFVTRAAFMVFFINYIRAPEHLRMIYAVALVFMVYTAINGIQGVAGGAGLHGYRAAVVSQDFVAGQVGLIRSAGNPNRLAMFAILAIAGLWYLLQSFRARWLSMMVGVPVLVVLALAVLMTASRSGLLGLCVCIAAIVWDEGLNLSKLLGIGLAVLLLLIVAVQFVPEKSLERITNLPFTQAGETGEGSGSLENRAYTWTIAAELFPKNPIFGIGMGNWAVVRFINDPGHLSGSAHNSYLLALVEGGVLGLGGFLALMWCAWRNLRFAEPYVSRPGSPLVGTRWVLKGAKASLLVLVFFSMFADLWQLVILFWLVGVSIVLRRMVEQALVEEPLAY